jgi:hypothetical protein
LVAGSRRDCHRRGGLDAPPTGRGRPESCGRRTPPGSRRPLRDGNASGRRMRCRRRRRRRGGPAGRLCRSRVLGWHGRCRQEQERIEVALLLGSPSYTEVEVGDIVLELAARPDRADILGFGDGSPASHGKRAQVNEGDGIAVGCLNRHTRAAPRHSAREGDGPCSRCDDRRPGGRADVDPAVLARRVGVVAEDEGPQHRALHGPRPGSRRRRAGQHYGQDGEDNSAHRASPSCCLFGEQSSARYQWRRLLSIKATERNRKGACAKRRSVGRRSRLPCVATAPRRRARPPPPRRQRRRRPHAAPRRGQARA